MTNSENVSTSIPTSITSQISNTESITTKKYKPIYRYTREQLLEIAKSPLCKIKPPNIPKEIIEDGSPRKRRWDRRRITRDYRPFRKYSDNNENKTIESEHSMDPNWEWKPNIKRERRRREGWLGSNAGNEPLTKDEEYRKAAFEEFRRQHRIKSEIQQEKPKEELKPDLDEPITEVDLLASEMFKSVIDDSSNQENDLETKEDRPKFAHFFESNKEETEEKFDEKHIELEAEKMIDTLLDEKVDSVLTEQDILKSLEKPTLIQMKPPLPPMPENVADVTSIEAELLKNTKQKESTEKQEPTKIDEKESPLMNIFKQLQMPQQIYHQPNIFNMMTPNIPPYNQQIPIEQQYMNPYEQYQAHQQYLMQQQLMMNMQRQRMQETQMKQPETKNTTTTPQKKQTTTPKTKSKLIPSQLLVQGVTKKKKETQPLDSDKDFPPLNSTSTPKSTQPTGISQWFPPSQSAFPPLTPQSPTIPADAKIFSVDEIEKQFVKKT